VYNKGQPLSAAAACPMDNGKKTFVARLFAEHRGALQAYFYRRIRTKSDASDLAQEVYLRMLRLGDTDSIRDPQRYLYAVASNLVKEHALRDRQQLRCVDIDEASAQELLATLPSLDGELDALQEAGRLRAALEQLPSRWRTAIILHYRYELTYDEIADRMGVSSNMIKKYLAQALGRCRRYLAQSE
jgi:RNA polymerase sigma-70 factor (ECF subfamily)